MSTGAECVFIEAKPGVWYYKLQEWPYGENPDYQTFGPFKSEDEADEHLSNHHANPGGCNVLRYEESDDDDDATLAALQKDVDA